MKIKWWKPIVWVALILSVCLPATLTVPVVAYATNLGGAAPFDASLGQGVLTGVVSTLGYCDGSPAAVPGATIEIRGRTGTVSTLTTDQTGAYSRVIDPVESPVQVSVTMPGYASATVTEVVISAGQTATQDFTVRSLKPCLSVAPSSMTANLSLGQSTTRPLHLTNGGAASATYSITAQTAGPNGVGDALWLSASPSASAIPADSALWATLAFDAGKVAAPGRYEASVVINSDDPAHPLILVPVTMSVTVPASWGTLAGTAQGMGHCDDAPAPLGGATVLAQGSTGMTRTTVTGEDGRYLLWLPAGDSPYRVSITARGHVAQTVLTVTVTPQGTMVLDANLRATLPCIKSSTGALSVTVPWGGVASRAFTLTNTGAASTAFTLTEQPGGFKPLRGRAAALHPSAPAEDILLVGTSASGPITAMQAVLTAQGRSFVLVDPASFSALSLADIQSHQAVIWLGYGLGASSPANVARMQAYLDAGGRALVAYGDLAYGWRNTAAPNFLTTYFGAQYKNDLGSQGVVTGRDIMTGVTTDLSADLYPDSVTLLGDAVGLFVNNPPKTDWAGVRLARASFETIGLFFNFNAVTSTFAQNAIVQNALAWLLPAPSGPVTWVSEKPMAGSLSADTGAQMIVVDFTANAAEITQPGDYSAALAVEGGPGESGDVTVPLTMTIAPPATDGRLSGAVRGLGSCDAHPAPLDGATVVVRDTSGFSQTLTTDAAGQYQYWLPAGAYTLTVSAAGHQTHLAAAVLTAGAAVTVNVDLRAQQPCIHLVPGALAAGVSVGMSTTLPITISNLGAGGLTFRVDAQQGGFGPLKPQTGGDVPAWLDVMPGAGTVAPDSMQQIRLALDASAPDVTQPGLYYGILNVSSNDPAASAIPIPVTMTVNPLGQQGKLAGTVRSLGYCDSHPAPVQGATVHVQHDRGLSQTLQTDAAGHYQMWGTESTAPLTITVTAADHAIGTATGVILHGGQAITQDFDLRWLEPCVSAAPSAAAVYLAQGFSQTVPLTLTNTGAVSTTFELTPAAGTPKQPAGTIEPGDWLAVAPRVGILDADAGRVRVAVTFDSAAVAEAGAYSGTLTIISRDPVHPSLTIPVTMNVGAPPECGFISSSPTLLGQATVFTSTSTGAASYRWNFGDDTSPGATANPHHTYGRFGVYTVTLTVANGWGERTCTHQATVEALPGPAFTGHQATPLSNIVAFANTTPDVLPAVTHWLWEFGDGQWSAERAPTHAYVRAGFYIVTLTATNARGRAVFTAQVLAGSPYVVYLPRITR
jgi:PKD repeat protein